MPDITKHKLYSAFLDTSLFRVIYIIILFFEMLDFLDVIALAAKCVVLVWGGVIFICKFLVNKAAFKVHYGKLLWGGIAAQIVSSFWNLSKDLPANLVFVYHSMICFFVFYGMYTEKEHKKLEKEMVFIFRAISILSTLFAILSVGILIFKAQINIGSYYLGIFRSRLIGIYTNQNLLAFSMVISIVVCDILRDNYIRKNYKSMSFPPWFAFGCAGINFLALFLSDSNASFLFIIIYFTTKIFYKSLSAYHCITPGQILREGSFLVVCCATMIAGSFIARNTCQEVINVFVYDIHRIEEPMSDDNPGPAPNPSALSAYMPDVSIGRENYDISSGRITLFKQGIKLFLVNPLFGIGRGNLVAYGDKFIDGGLAFSDLHNSYLTILVSYGILGFTILFAFAFFLSKSVCKYLFSSVHIENSTVFSKLFSALAAYCAYAVFEKGLLSEITFMVVIFWLILGYTMSYKEYGENTYDIHTA